MRQYQEVTLQQFPPQTHGSLSGLLRSNCSRPVRRATGASNRHLPSEIAKAMLISLLHTMC